MNFLIKPISFLIIIFIGYFFKRIRLFKALDYKVINAIVLCITLPCAVIQAFSRFERDPKLFLIVFFGFVCSIVPMMAAYLLTHRTQEARRVFMMINITGYSIGCFALPLIQSFYGSDGAVIACIFDIGNAIMMTGGAFALTSTLLHTDGDEEKAGALSFIKKFVTSVPFDTYILMLLLAIFDIKIPDIIISLTAPAASANAFLAMLMVGMMLEFEAKKEYLLDTAIVVLGRLVFGVVFALLLFYFAPFEPEVRKVLAVLAFAPISALAPVYTERCRGDGALSSFASSVSALVSMATMTALVYIF
ncbi:MAG: AEC family transporter [Oscillospiraceae bacterium]